jgi:hypothetical protein
MGAGLREAVERGEYFGRVIPGLQVFKRFQDPSLLPDEISDPGSQPHQEEIRHFHVKQPAELLLRVKQDIEWQTVPRPEFSVRSG